ALHSNVVGHKLLPGFERAAPEATLRQAAVHARKKRTWSGASKRRHGCAVERKPGGLGGEDELSESRAAQAVFPAVVADDDLEGAAEQRLALHRRRRRRGRVGRVGVAVGHGRSTMDWIVLRIVLVCNIIRPCTSPSAMACPSARSAAPS